MKQQSLKNGSLFHTGREHIIKTQKIKVCDEPVKNRNVTNSLSMRQTVQNVSYSQHESEINGFKVIVEFPDKSGKEDEICKEVQQILTALLLKEMEQVC